MVAGFDNDGEKVGTTVGHLQIRHISSLPDVVAETGAEIGVLTVPAPAAQHNYDSLVEAGVKAVLNFAPARLKLDPQVQTKNVDLSINLEELGYHLRNGGLPPG